MSLKKSERIREIVRILLHCENEITAKSLSSQLHVSSRTVYSDLDSSEMKQFIYPSTIVKVPNVGIKLDASKEDKDRLFYKINDVKKVNISNRDEYFKFVYTVLFLDYKTIDKLMSKLYLSKNAIYNYLEMFNEDMKRFDVIVKRKTNQGIYLSGSEIDIQRAISTIFYELCSENIDITKVVDIAEIRNCLEDIDLHLFNEIEKYIQLSQRLLNNEYTNESKCLLFLQIFIKIYRLKLGHQIQPLGKVDKTIIEYSIAEVLTEKMKHTYQLDLTQSDCNHLTILLIGARKQLQNEVINYQIVSEDEIQIFINQIGKQLGVDFSKDYQFKDNLTKHLVPAIRRIEVGAKSTNSMLNKIKNDYTLVYVSTMIALEELQNKLDIYFSDSEIGFICLHVIVALNKARSIEKYKACLISDASYSMSLFLKNCIEVQFEDILVEQIYSPSDITSIDETMFELIINSSIVQDERFISISPDFRGDDINKIEVCKYNLVKTDKLRSWDLFKNNLFLFNNYVEESQTSIIDKYSSFLVESGFVTEAFGEGVKTRIVKSNTYVGNNVAIVHGYKEDSLRSGIVIIKQNVPITWNKQKIELLFLVVVAEESGDYQHFFRNIIKLVSSPQKIEDLKKCNDIEDILKLL